VPYPQRMSQPYYNGGEPQQVPPGYPQQMSGPPYASSPAPQGYPQQQALPQGGYVAPQAGYAQAGYQVPQGQPYGAYPGQAAQFDAQGRPLSDKSKVVAGLLGILLGGFGAGRFYTGHTGLAVGQLLVTIFTCGLGHFWGLIDGIMILVNGGTDAQGRVLRENA
jgi:TM2 domain-containing membrane protein YozV